MLDTQRELKTCLFLQDLPEVVTASCQDDAVRGEALPFNNEGDIAVFLTGHQSSQLLRQQLAVVNFGDGRRWTQRVTVAHGPRWLQPHLTRRKTVTTSFTVDNRFENNVKYVSLFYACSEIKCL